MAVQKASVLFAVIIFASTILTGVHPQSQAIVFGDCVAERRSCRDCYLTLKQELLKRDDNVFDLSEAFFPPDTNPPEFVTITYNFKDDGTEYINESQIWYWVEQSSYFLFPPHTFQYLSLFFGKPEEFYAQEVSLILNATDCLGVQTKYMTLLTQRVSIKINNNYCSTFNSVYRNNVKMLGFPHPLPLAINPRCMHGRGLQ